MTIIKVVTAVSQEKTNMSSESESETFTVKLSPYFRYNPCNL